MRQLTNKIESPLIWNKLTQKLFHKKQQPFIKNDKKSQIKNREDGSFQTMHPHFRIIGIYSVTQILNSFFQALIFVMLYNINWVNKLIRKLH